MLLWKVRVRKCTIVCNQYDGTNAKCMATWLLDELDQAIPSLDHSFPQTLSMYSLGCILAHIKGFTVMSKEILCCIQLCLGDLTTPDTHLQMLEDT